MCEMKSKNKEIHFAPQLPIGLSLTIENYHKTAHARKDSINHVHRSINENIFDAKVVLHLKRHFTRTLLSYSF